MGLLTSADCLKKYGAPDLERNMILWDVPVILEIGVIPKRIYCNKDMFERSSRYLKRLPNLIKTNYVTELLTDGMAVSTSTKARGCNKVAAIVLSWGVAIDVNMHGIGGQSSNVIRWVCEMLYRRWVLRGVELGLSLTVCTFS